MPHDPLLPALLALPMRIGGWAAAKATLALLAGGLAATVLWTAVRRGGVRPGVAAPITILFGASAPLATYGSQVYPELPAAAAVAIAVAALTGPLAAGGLAVLGAAVVALPWLGVKYAAVAAVLALIGLARLLRTGRRRAATVLFAGFVLAGAVYGLAHLAWYGGLTVYAAGAFFQRHGGELAVVGLRPDYVGRGTRLLGLLAGREFGLIPWQPAWLLAVPAVAWLAGRRRVGHLDAVTVLLPLSAGWLMATFVAATMHGWWFPGRQVVVVLPAAVLAVILWASDDDRRLLPVLALGAVGVLTHVWLAAETWTHRVSWVVSFASTANPLYRVIAAALPGYRQPSAGTWWLHGLWAAVVLVLAWWGWRTAGRARFARSANAT